MKIRTKTFKLVCALLVALGLAQAGWAVISDIPVPIAGHVRDLSGNPVGGVDVTVDDYVGDVFHGKTDADGHYSVDLNAEGNYRVALDCAQLTALDFDCVAPGAVTITSGPAELDFTVPPAPLALTITNTFLPDGQVGAVYKMQLGAKGGHPPYKWRLARDSAPEPAGVMLNSLGLLYGTPRTNGMATIDVQVTDSHSAVTNLELSVTVQAGRLSGMSASPPPKIGVQND